MRRPLYFGLVLLFILTFTSCNKSKSGNDQVEIADQTEGSAKPKPEEIVVNAAFECLDLSKADDPFPSFEVRLILNEKIHIIDTTNACGVFEKEEYSRYDVPGEASAACGGWYAGGGDYFYALLEKNACIVMQGYQDEGQTDEGFHYEQVRRFVVFE